MLSRIAESMYWMARYLERAGETARLMEINLLYLVEAEEDMSAEERWRPILQITSAGSLYASEFHDPAITTERVLQFISAGQSNPSSIRTCLRQFRENARVARDRISKEMWIAVNEMWMKFKERLKEPPSSEGASQLFNELRNEVARFNGLAASTMMRGEAFNFYRLGGYVERADMTVRILDVKYHILLPDLSMVGSALDFYQWAALLKSLSGFEAFRRSYQSDFTPADVAEFVVLNRDFPRSVVYSIERMHASLPAISSARDGAVQSTYRDLIALTQTEDAFAEGLHEILESLLQGIARFHTALAEEFFH